jgi:WD40 repeat protein
VRGLAFSPDGRRLASAAGEGLNLWDCAGRQQTVTVRTNQWHFGYVVAFSPDGRRIACALPDRTVAIFEATTGRMIGRPFARHGSRVQALAFSADGRRLTSADEEGTTKIWDAATGEESLSWRAAKNPNFAAAWALAFSPDGRLLASSHPETVRVWDATTGKQIATFAGPQMAQQFRGLAFSADGRSLAHADEDVRLKFSEVATGQQRTFASRGGLYWTHGSLTFSRDGRLLASGNGNDVKLWDVEAGHEVRTLHGHTMAIECLAFSADGQRLVSGSRDETVRVWDVNTGYEILTLHGQAGEVRSVAFAHDGWRILSAHRDGTIKIWDATPLTEETRIEREATNMVAFLVAKPLSREQVLTAIRQDQTISAPLRQKALELAGQAR